MAERLRARSAWAAVAVVVSGVVGLLSLRVLRRLRRPPVPESPPKRRLPRPESEQPDSAVEAAEAAPNSDYVIAKSSTAAPASSTAFDSSPHSTYSGGASASFRRPPASTVSTGTASTAAPSFSKAPVPLEIADFKARLDRLMRRLAADGSTAIASADGLEYERLLGHGSFGSAELHRRTADGKQVVLKRAALRSLSLSELSTLSSEVAHAAGLRHKHIVQFYGACLLEESRDAFSLCMFLEFAAGGTIGEVIAEAKKTHGRLSTPWVTTWLSQTCAAVQFMHSRDVLHRDLSSANVFLAGSGAVRVGDLGLSKKLGSQQFSMIGGSGGRTQAHSLVGTPPYMSPEMVQGKPYNKPSDVWALGILLFEMLSLRLPFAGSNLVAVAMEICSGRPNEESQQALNNSGHPYELRALAGRTGLLHPDPPMRMSLQQILLRDPVPATLPTEPWVAGGGGPAPSESMTDATSLRGDLTEMGSLSELLSDSGSSSEPIFRRRHCPIECPMMPAAMQPRLELLEALKAMLHEGPRGFYGATVAHGMGGAGKSTLAAQLMRSASPEFDTLCWVTLGQTPDLCALLRVLLRQISGESEDTAGDLNTLAINVGSALRSRNAFIVIDDVWDAAHLRPYFDALGDATLLITTRIAQLLRGISHKCVTFGAMSEREAVQLLLEAGGIALPGGEQPDDVPEAAFEAVKLCGCLPLALALAGGMLQEHADDWTEALVPLLRGDNRAELRKRAIADAHGDAHAHVEYQDNLSTEDRIITSSLDVMRSKGQHGPATLLGLFAVFAEDTTIPCAVLDALEPTLTSAVTADASARGAKDVRIKTNSRRWVLVLTSYSLLGGSIRDGISIHDLVRGFVIADAGEEGVRALQRSAVADLLGALERKEVNKDLLKYAMGHLAGHVGAARMPEAEGDGNKLLGDELLLNALIQSEHEWVRAEVVKGLGAPLIKRAAQSAADDERWLLSARLWWAASQSPDDGEGRWATWRSLRRIDPPTTESVELEAAVIRALVLKRGGFKINSAEHEEANARVEVLRATEPGAASAALASARDSSLSMLQFYRVCSASSVFDVASFPEIYYALFEIGGTRTATKLGASESAGRACAALQLFSGASSMLHQTKSYDWEVDFGPEGSWLRDLMAWYDFEEVHRNFKVVTGRDACLSGLGGALLLLRWGDLECGLADWDVATSNWTKLAGDVRAGKSKWSDYRIDLVDMRSARGIAIATGHYDVARTLFFCSPEGNEEFAGDFERHVESVVAYMKNWGMQCTWTTRTAALMSRMLRLVLLTDDKWAAAAAQAFEWLPPAAELLAIAEAEKAWDVFMLGPQHPALLGAMMYARLKQWSTAIELVEGLLDRLTQPLCRIEAWRLLGRCLEATATPAAAHEPLLCAADEAAKSGYLLLELQVRRDLYLRGGCEIATLSELVWRTASEPEAVAAYLGDEIDAGKLLAGAG